MKRSKWGNSLAAMLSVMLVVPFASVGCASVDDGEETAEDRISTEELQISRVNVAGPSDEGDRYLLDVTVGTISESKFEALHARFGTEPATAYDATKSYKLVDFLPAFARETNAKVLVPYSTPAERVLLDAFERQEMASDGMAYVDANCHSVTWQWVNHVQGQGGDDAVLTLMDGEALFAETAAFAVVRAEDLQPGDLYFAKGSAGFEQVDAILHSGVYLGDELVFEKGNPGEDYPYRIAYLEDVTSKYRRVDPAVEFIFRRISSSSVLKTPSQALSLAARKTELGLADVDERILRQYQVQETWNWELDRSDFTLGWLLPSRAAEAGKLFSYGAR